MHNKGPAPLGNQPVSVFLNPQHVSTAGPFTLRLTIATDTPTGERVGKVRLVLPDGWTAEPAEYQFKLQPNGYDEVDVTLSPPDGAVVPGRWFVAAELADGDQIYEDVVRVDLLAEGDPAERRGELPSSGGFGWVTGGPTELVAELRTPRVAAAPGSGARLVVAVRNHVAGAIHGEAQLISPYETWPLLTPWTAGFEVAPGAEVELAYDLTVPPGTRPGRWWALVKLMWFGKVHYTAAAVVEVLPPGTPAE